VVFAGAASTTAMIGAWGLFGSGTGDGAKTTTPAPAEVEVGVGVATTTLVVNAKRLRRTENCILSKVLRGCFEMIVDGSWLMSWIMSSTRGPIEGFIVLLYN